MPKFKLPNPEAGQVIINDRYVFVDGEMTCSKQDAKSLEKILCRFYACELIDDEEVEEVQDDKSDGSLAVDATKQGAKPVEEKPAEVKPAAKAGSK